MTASIFKEIYSCGEMRSRMKKFSIIALAFSAGAVLSLAVSKILSKKCCCGKKYYDDEFEDNYDNYDFETDCCADDDLEVVMPAEEADKAVEVKVEEKTPSDEEKEEEKTED